nr:hypothetical protein CFP56_16685 [Quercus suber]
MLPYALLAIARPDHGRSAAPDDAHTTDTTGIMVWTPPMEVSWALVLWSRAYSALATTLLDHQLANKIVSWTCGCSLVYQEPAKEHSSGASALTRPCPVRCFPGPLTRIIHGGPPDQLSDPGDFVETGRAHTGRAKHHRFVRRPIPSIGYSSRSSTCRTQDEAQHVYTRHCTAPRGFPGEIDCGWIRRQHRSISIFTRPDHLASNASSLIGNRHTRSLTQMLF